MNIKERIFADIDAEHQQVLGKWGVQVHDKNWWLIFLFEEFGELAEALAEYCHPVYGQIRKNLIHAKLWKAYSYLRKNLWSMRW